MHAYCFRNFAALLNIHLLNVLLVTPLFSDVPAAGKGIFTICSTFSFSCLQEDFKIDRDISPALEAATSNVGRGLNPIYNLFPRLSLLVLPCCRVESPVPRLVDAVVSFVNGRCLFQDTQKILPVIESVSIFKKRKSQRRVKPGRFVS